MWENYTRWSSVPCFGHNHLLGRCLTSSSEGLTTTIRWPSIAPWTGVSEVVSMREKWGDVDGAWYITKTEDRVQQSWEDLGGSGFWTTFAKNSHWILVRMREIYFHRGKMRMQKRRGEIRNLWPESAKEFRGSKPPLECLPGRHVRLKGLCQTPEEQKSPAGFVLFLFGFAFLAEVYVVEKVFSEPWFGSK